MLSINRASAVLGGYPRRFSSKLFEKTISIVDSLLTNQSPIVAEEFSRLRSIPRIKKSLRMIEETENHNKKEAPFSYYELSLEKDKLVSIGRSMELCEHLKSSHYVVNTAVCGKIAFFNVFTKKITEMAEQRKYRHFEPLRHPLFLEGVPENRDVEWYKTELRKAGDEGSKVDFHYSNELISGDIFLESIRTNCSAIDLFARGRNLSSNKVKFCENILENIVSYYCSKTVLIQDGSKKIMALQPMMADTLYSICIPKDKFSEVAYLSWIGGRPAEDRYTLDDLISWQDGELTKNGYPPQVRLLAKQLSPKNGVLILSHSSMTVEEVQELESKLEKHVGSLLQ